MHAPVLLQEVIKFLDPKPGDFIIDGTVDGGGHSTKIFPKILPGGKLLGTDWDAQFLPMAQKKILAEVKSEKLKAKNLILRQGNYADLLEILKKEKFDKADGLLLDLGFSSEQLENSGKGFSFLKDEPLLMTYDSRRPPVKELLKNIDVKSLAKIIFELSGEKFAMRIARAIKNYQKSKPIETSGELKRIIVEAVPKGYERGRIDPATRTFQALRIWANDELGNLQKILSLLQDILKTGARIVIISFHSLEDRLVKQEFRAMEKGGRLKILTKKPVVPSAEEEALNPRSRSAKLRAAILK